MRPPKMALVLGGLLMAACAKPPVTSDAAANADDASVVSTNSAGLNGEAGIVEEPASSGDAGLPRFAVVLSVRGDAGPESIADSGELDTAAALSVWVPLRLKDFRVRLFDDHDQLVASDDTVAEVDAGIDYRLEFMQPLRAGRGYSLLVDAEVGSVILDEQGRAWDDVRIDLKVRGEPQPDEARKPVRAPANKRMKRR